MKVTYNKTIKRYIVSELGTILHTTVSFDDASRLAGFEPDLDGEFEPETDEDDEHENQ